MQDAHAQGRVRAGTVSDTVALAAGGRATCRFFNVRVGHPAIAIDKSGPAIAQAGDTLHYTLRVTNPGSVPFPEDQVDVSDPACDGAPKLSDKSDGSGPDGSSGTLDPGDVWTYTCSRKTAEPGEDCELTDRQQHRDGERLGRRGDGGGQQHDHHDADLSRHAATGPARSAGPARAAGSARPARAAAAAEPDHADTRGAGSARRSRRGDPARSAAAEGGAGWRGRRARDRGSRAA